jgi:RNA polymerase sigma factor (sigma-70 family)
MRKTALRHPARLAGSSFLRLQSDERLAELAAAGHDAAFDAIVVRYRAPLLRYCGAIVGSSRAEDAVQQTLLNAHGALGAASDDGEVRHLRSWLYRIAHNVSLNLLRGVRDDVSLDADGADALPLLRSAPSSSESFEDSEQFRATVAALQALPERQRAALVLRELEGRSHEEIASALGVSAGSARQHLMRGRAAMRAAVTAVTPWGLIVRLAEMASTGGGAPGGLEAAAGAGLGAGLAKVTAGVMATGALVGGAAVGTHEVVRHDSAAPAQADVVHTTSRRSSHSTTTERPISLTTTTRTATSPRAAEPQRHGRGKHHDDSSSSHRTDDHNRGRGRDDSTAEHSNSGSSSGSSHSGPSSHGADDSTTSHSGRRSGSDDATSGRSDDSGSGKSSRSGGSDDSSGSGSGSGRSRGGSGDTSVAVTTPAPVTPAPESSGSDDSGSSHGGSGSGKRSGSDDSSGSGSDDDVSGG